MVRECCCSWHNNYAFAWHGYVTIKKFKSNHQMFSTGAWKPGHETRNKAKGEYVFKTSFLFLPYISFHAKFELYGQALFQAFFASILNIEGRPKRYRSALWCQVADDKDTLGEYLINLSEALSCTCNVCPKFGHQSTCKTSIRTASSICTHMLLRTCVRLTSLSTFHI